MTAFDDSVVNSVYTNCDEIIVPANSCVVVWVNVQCELVIILNGNIPLLCMWLATKIENIQNK